MNEIQPVQSSCRVSEGKENSHKNAYATYHFLDDFLLLYFLRTKSS